ncbi:class I SAM-dependent methyltransferase [Fulvimarina endophytica]|uniref:Class I SAM-dependent methyltransferase n=1 Tax=Fulvimarina endophytica TaxID=2293836 RepID=A0A371X3Y5_9HYPH|nr:class I SAM-dependent methyltransferase [Fulvimarina endophytica]RFC63724.1 class I SAM-dependent methyltransferase [Fulvimarina endophytica]
MNCLACGSIGLFDSEKELKEFGTDVVLKICGQCGSGTFSPLPTIDYRTHTNSDYDLRDYVELNANIGFLAGSILRLIDQRPPGRLLDIGCGFGFAADSVRRLLGWEVVGFEPSRYGVRGAEILGVDIRPEYLTADHPMAQQKYDVIHVSEVIEHIEEPQSFIAFLASLLSEDGMIIASTPDISVLDNDAMSRSIKLSVLSIGAHTVLFSRSGLEQLFESVGLSNIHCELRGTSHLIVASKVPYKKPKRSMEEFYEAYLRSLIEVDAMDPMLEMGVVSRLFSFYVNHGQFDKADPLLERVIKLSDVSHPISNFDAFLENTTTIVPYIYYYIGMHYYAYKGNYELSRFYFLLCWQISIEKIRRRPAVSVVESDLLWRSFLHYGLSCEALGDDSDAQSAYARLQMDGGRDLPSVQSDVRSRAKERYRNPNGS